MAIIRSALIDTNIYSYLLKGDEEITEGIRRLSAIGLSCVSIGELLAGFRRGNNERENRRRLGEFLDSPRVATYGIDEITAEHYSAIFNQLRKVGAPIPTNDIWIAAVALQHGLPLFSRDKHFTKVAGLLLFE